MSERSKSKSKPRKADTHSARGYVVDSDDPAEVAKALAKCIPEWSELKETQRAELVQHSIQSRARPTRAKVASNMVGEVAQISPPDVHEASHAIRIYETFATASDDIVMTRLTEMHSHFASSGGDVGRKMSAALAFIAGCNPENEHQSAMATQMALLHDAAMTALGAAKRAEYMDNFEKYSNQANKLLRTFGVLTDSYAKLQRGGVQTVKHVNVYEGGQAVVADTVHAGGLNARMSDPAHAASSRAPVLGYDAQGNGVPISSGEWEAAMPDAWRRKG